MNRTSLIRRLGWYFPLELYNVMVFSALLFFVILEYTFVDVILLLYGLLLIAIILFQGQHYWKLKLHRLKGLPVNQHKSLQFFVSARRMNTMLIFLMPFIFLIQIGLSGWDGLTKNTFLWGIAANAFGVLEHVNYYHWQLTIDKYSDLSYLLRNRKFKTSSLRKDLDRAEI